jgi:ABC-type glycerol-3-phosphate transport system substrate-binding protein
MTSDFRRFGLLATTALCLAATPLAAQTVTLQWQTANLTESQFEPVWQAIIEEFEAAHPGIAVEPILVARADHWTRFVTAAQARQAPCVVSVDVTTAAYNGYLLPLDDYWNAEPEEFRAAWSEDILSGARWEGELYGIPSWGGVYAEVYNLDVVEAAGLDPESPPVTWEDYFAWAEAMSGPDQWATAILGGRTDTTTRVLLAWIYSNGGEPFNDAMTEARFAADPRSLEAIKAYLTMEREGLAAPGSTTINYLEQTNLFAQNRIGTMRNAYWSIAKVLGDNPALEGRLLVADPPMNTDRQSTLATMTADSISSSCAHPDEAWEFIKFNNERQWAVQRATVANWMPMRNDIADDPEVQADPMLRKFVEIGGYARTYPLPHPHWADISTNDIVDAVQRALLEPDRIEEIFTELDALLTEKLNDL